MRVFSSAAKQEPPSNEARPLLGDAAQHRASERSSHRLSIKVLGHDLTRAGQTGWRRLPTAPSSSSRARATHPGVCFIGPCHRRSTFAMVPMVGATHPAAADKMLSRRRLCTVSLLWAISTPLVGGQRTTYTGCHNHTEASAAVEYCYGPDGAETARATHAVTGSAGLPGSVSASATAEAQTTAVTGCHSHETAVFCINGAGEEVHVEATPTGEVPPAYTGCHAHDTEV